MLNGDSCEWILPTRFNYDFKLMHSPVFPCIPPKCLGMFVRCDDEYAYV